MSQFVKNIEQSLTKLFAMWQVNAKVTNVTVNENDVTVSCICNDQAYKFDYIQHANGDVWFKPSH